MAKYIVEIPDEVPVSDELVPFDMCRPSWYWEAYKKGKAEAEDEVWEFVRKLSCMKYEETRDCFGIGYEGEFDVLSSLHYSEAKDKYDAWNQEKEDETVKKKVIDLADEIGIHKLYSVVVDIRGE